MARIIIVFFIVIAFSSCSSPTGVRDFVSGADSVAINYFTGDGKMDSVVKVVIIRNRQQVDSLAAFIESPQMGARQCGYDGSIHFFKTNMVLKDIDFRMNDAKCSRFSFAIGNNIYQTKLSEKAKLFLQNAAK